MLSKFASPRDAAAAAANPSTRDATPTDFGGEAADQIPQLSSEVELQNAPDIMETMNLNPTDAPALPSVSPSKSQSIVQAAAPDRSALEIDSCIDQQDQQSEEQASQVGLNR